MVIFKLPIKLLPSPRPRVTKFGTYMPKAYVNQKNYIQAKIRCFSGLGNVPIRCTILCGFKMPKSGIKRNKFKMPRGDNDNLAKSVLDACNGILFEDDVQICELNVKKMYAEYDFIHVTFEEVSYDQD